MARFIKWAAVPAVLLAGLFVSGASAQAGDFYGHQYGYNNHCYRPAPVYHQPVYHKPIYHQPAYPVYQQKVHYGHQHQGYGHKVHIPAGYGQQFHGGYGKFGY